MPLSPRDPESKASDELLVPEKAWLELNLIPIAMGLTTTAGLIFAILAR